MIRSLEKVRQIQNQVRQLLNEMEKKQYGRSDCPAYNNAHAKTNRNVQGAALTPCNTHFTHNFKVILKCGKDTKIIDYVQWKIFYLPRWISRNR